MTTLEKHLEVDEYGLEKVCIQGNLDKYGFPYLTLEDP